MTSASIPRQPSVGYPSDQSRAASRGRISRMDEFWYPQVGSHISDKADLLDGRYVNGGEGTDPIRAWMEKTAIMY